MPRTARVAPGGVVYHVLNRAVGRATLFRSRRDYEAFQRCLVDTLEAMPTRVLSYCIMPNHWHLVLWPERDGDLARFMLRLTITHVRRWLIFRQQVGTGHLYQGRYKSFPVQNDAHLSAVCRYAIQCVREK
jgi:putative transposase